MILDANGTPTSHIAHTLVKMPEEPATPTEPQKRRDYVPAPGRVTVLRHEAPRRYDTDLDLIKDEKYAQRDDFFSIYATVARIGKQIPGGTDIWFAIGDVVTIAPSMFDEIELTPGDSVWCGPVAAVTGKFEEVAEEPCSPPTPE